VVDQRIELDPSPFRDEEIVQIKEEINQDVPTKTAVG
jgi:hypothetical protein